MSKMNIALRFEGEKLFAETEISLDENLSEFTFNLNSGLEISGVSCDEKSADLKIISVHNPRSRCFSEWKEYSVKCGSDFGTVKICYSGKISGWHNFITDEIIELNWYSVWFPCGLICEAGYFVTISGCKNYFLLKGECEGDLLQYSGGGSPFEFYIILYKKSVLKAVEGEHISVYYIDSSLTEAAELSKNIFEDILDYYTKELFRREYGGHIEMACVYPILKSGGKYKRKNLIVCTMPVTDEREAVTANAHELAYEWCHGADEESWEDWLNETTAEWSMLLYCLDRNKTEIFDKMIAEHMEKYPEFPPIKTSDGRGVRIKGTVVFYELYKAFGAEMIKSIIRLFVDLKVKTTENLLDKMKALGMTEAAELLEKNLS